MTSEVAAAAARAGLMPPGEPGERPRTFSRVLVAYARCIFALNSLDSTYYTEHLGALCKRRDRAAGVSTAAQAPRNGLKGSRNMFARTSG